MTADRLSELETLELGAVDGRVSATCGSPAHPTWLRAMDDTRGCPWCRLTEVEEALAERTRQLNGLLDALGYDEKAVPA